MPLFDHLPPRQLIRYLCVGVFNTLFGYACFAVTLTLLTHALPQRYLYLTVVLASIIGNLISINVAYLGYKFLVFQTRGNYLREWLKCFAVYGTAMLPGLFALSAITRLLQSLIHSHAAALHTGLSTTEAHLHGHALTWLQSIAHGPAMAGYIAGAIVIGFSTIYSFIGHKKVTFKTKAPAESPGPIS